MVVATQAGGTTLEVSASSRHHAGSTTKFNSAMIEKKVSTEDASPRMLMMQGTGGGDTHPEMINHDKFILDSGAAVHATPDDTKFSVLTQVRPKEVVVVASGQALAVHGQGPVSVPNVIRLDKVSFIPGLARNIVSVSMLVDLGYSVRFTNNGCLVKDTNTGDEVGTGRLVSGLYVLDHLEIPVGRIPAGAQGNAQL